MTAAALSLGALTPGLADPTTATCTPAKVKLIADPDGRSTSSTSYANLGGTAVKLTQGGSSASCVIVYFSAEVSTSGANTMFLRATLDGTPDLSLPTEVAFVTGLAGQTHAASFIFASVPPGSHTVRLQFRSQPGSNTATVLSSNTIVHYAP